MDIKKLNEELQKFVVNEISDELRQRYIDGRRKQVQDIKQQLKDLKKKQKRLDVSVDKHSQILQNKERVRNSESELIAKVGNVKVFKTEVIADNIKGIIGYKSNYVDGMFEDEFTFFKTIADKLAKECLNGQDIWVNNYCELCYRLPQAILSNHFTNRDDFILYEDTLRDLVGDTNYFWEKPRGAEKFVERYQKLSDTWKAIWLYYSGSYTDYPAKYKFYNSGDNDINLINYAHDHRILRLNGNKLYLYLGWNPEEKIGEIQLHDLPVPEIKGLPYIKYMDHKESFIMLHTIKDFLDSIMVVFKKRQQLCRKFTDEVNAIYDNWIKENQDKLPEDFKESMDNQDALKIISDLKVYINKYADELNVQDYENLQKAIITLQKEW